MPPFKEAESPEVIFGRQIGQADKAMALARDAFKKDPNSTTLDAWRNAALATIKTADRILSDKKLDNTDGNTVFDARILKKDATVVLEIAKIAELDFVRRGTSGRHNETALDIAAKVAEFKDAHKKDILNPKDLEIVNDMGYYASAQLRQNKLVAVPHLLGKKPMRKVEPLDSHSAEVTAEKRYTKLERAESDFLCSMKEYNQMRSSGQPAEVVSQSKEIALNMYENLKRLGGGEGYAQLVSSMVGVQRPAGPAAPRIQSQDIQTAEDARAEFNDRQREFNKANAKGNEKEIEAARMALVKAAQQVIDRKDIGIGEKAYVQNVKDSVTPRIDQETGLMNITAREIRQGVDQEMNRPKRSSGALDQRLGSEEKLSNAEKLESARLAFNKAMHQSREIAAPESAFEKVVESALKLAEFGGPDAAYALRAGREALGNIENGDAYQSLEMQLTVSERILNEKLAQVAARQQHGKKKKA